MKITRLHAENVHGYLPIDIEFFPDLTFLTGLNGSGKTSALRLLMALLTPNMEEFSSISFTTAVATVSYDGTDVAVSARKSPEGLELSIDSIDDKLCLSSADLELLSEQRRREESRSPVHEKVLAHQVFKAIRKMTTPMFLGLDRHSFVPAPVWDDTDEARRREFLARRMWVVNPSSKDPTVTGLSGVNFLIADKMIEIRASQELLDETLRRKLLTSAFEYKPAKLVNFNKAPSRPELERYRERLAHIERAAEGFRLPVPELKTALTGFFDSLTNVVDALEKAAEKARTKDKKSKSGIKRGTEPSRNINLMEWIFNKTQADSIIEHLQWLDQYGLDRTALREPIDRFVSLANKFLQQTHKRVTVEGKGDSSYSWRGLTSHDE